MNLEFFSNLNASVIIQSNHQCSWCQTGKKKTQNIKKLPAPKSHTHTVLDTPGMVAPALPRQPVTLLDHPFSEEISLNIQSLAQLGLLHLCVSPEPQGAVLGPRSS